MNQTPKSKNAISPTRAEDYPEWYQQVIQAGELAENSPVRGCMVIKPWGYAIWENIQRLLDKKLKDTGHKNAYFPIFIPVSFLEKEATHVEGFAKECAVVTHSRLEMNSKRKLVPASPLDEPLIVRPTSETIIGEMYSKWVQSYRDLPILINQWCNVVRWEMRTRLFLRTTEFLWQEGHTAHATKEEALEETRMMLRIYSDFFHEYFAIPVIEGEKTESERFPGADSTLTIEAMMQDFKALQAGTSHFLGQNFSKASNITFLDKDGTQKFAWTTSWAISTRVIGGLVMTHSDDDGLVLPPRIAPAHAVIIPIIHKEEDRANVLEYCQKLKKDLENIPYAGAMIQIEIDNRDMRGGEKTWAWIKKGIPLRIEIGPRDIAQDSIMVGRRDKDHKTKVSFERAGFIKSIVRELDNIQENLLNRAKAYREANTVRIDTKEEFYDFFQKGSGGFAYCHWNGKKEVEEQLKNDLKVTIRCIPLNSDKEPGKCVITGEPSKQRVYFARSY